MKTAGEWYLDAVNALSEPKKSIEYCDKALEVDPNFEQAYYMKGIALSSLNQQQEAMDAFDKAISINPNFSQAYYCKGNMLAELKNVKEAIVCFDKAISLDPNFSQAYYVKGAAIATENKYEESITYFDKAISLNPDLNQAYYAKGNILRDLKKPEEAILCYNRGVELDPNNVLYYCQRANCLNELGKQQEALKDFAKAQELLKKGIVSSGLTSAHLEYVKNIVNSIVELHNMTDDVEDQIKEVQKDNPVAQKIIAKVQLLKEQKNKIAGKVMGQLGKESQSEMQKYQDELAAFKRQLQEEMDTMKKEIKNINVAVQELKNGFEDMKEELSTKMSDYKSKLDVELAKLDLKEEEKASLREYYGAFLETFSSTHVTSQVIDSGQVSLDTGSSATSILSMVASFAPFIGDALSTGISSIGEFLKSQKMIKNARKMKGLAADATELSQLIGKSGFEIVLNKEKQKKILQVTEADIAERSENLLGKIREFCAKIGDQVDAYLYTRLYKTPAARLGHMDANKLIELWIDDKISPYNVQKLFVEKIVSEGDDEPKSDMNKQSGENTKANRGQSGCCNMF